MARHHAAVALIALALVGCNASVGDDTPHSWCEVDETDEVVQDIHCFEGQPGYEWEYDDPRYNPLLVPYYVDAPGGGKTTVYKAPVPGYKPPVGYKAPTVQYKAPSAPAYKPPPAPAYKPPPAPAYKPPPPPPPKTGK